MQDNKSRLAALKPRNVRGTLAVKVSSLHNYKIKDRGPRTRVATKREREREGGEESTEMERKTPWRRRMGENRGVNGGARKELG